MSLAIFKRVEKKSNEIIVGTKGKIIVGIFFRFHFCFKYYKITKMFSVAYF